MKTKSVITALKQMGFDNSRKGLNAIDVLCSQCNALVINGIACHETGCPNTKYQCKGCYEYIDYQGYCSDCQ